MLKKIKTKIKTAILGKSNVKTKYRIGYRLCPLIKKIETKCNK